MERVNEIPYNEIIRMLKKAGLRGNKALTRLNYDVEDIPDLSERIKNIIGIVKQSKPLDMLYFIMYDIEDDKIRRYIAKYLEQKGCVRIQKSIFLASSNRKVFDEIKNTLKEINNMYNNHDSIVMVPISADELRAMQIIGNDIDLTIFIDNPNTLFF